MVRDGRLKLTFSSDLKLLDPARQSFETFCAGQGVTDEDVLYWSWVGIQEALVNAICHGNRENPEMPVVFDVAIEKCQLVCRITDRGPGVDLDSLPDPTAPENLMRPSGRGFLFIQKSMDRLTAERTNEGFTLILEKHLPGGE